MSFEDDLIQLPCALFRDEWLRLTEMLWGCKAERVSYCLPNHDLPRLEGVFYLTKAGKVLLPPTHAFLPFRFIFTSSRKDCQLYSQKIELLKMLAADIKRRGWKGPLAFPPGFVDGRAFQWAGIDIDYGYTFVGKLPYDEAKLDTSVRKNIRKATNAGYTAVRTNDWDAVANCLKKTQKAKGFSYYLNAEHLSLVEQYLGSETLFAHLVYSPDGIPVCAQVKLAYLGGICVDWLAGTDRAYLNDGVNQLLYATSLQDVTDAGTPYFDYCGANIESVALAKSKWGFPLIPYIIVKERPVMRILRHILKRSKLVKAVYYSQKNAFSPANGKKDT